VLTVAGDPALKGESAEAEKRDKIRKIIGEMFDFTTLSKLTLGRYWKKFNAGQQKEFVSLYRSILEKVYMDRILEYTGEKVSFTKEIMLSKKKAEVRSELITASKSIPINYRMYLKGGEWRVYDLLIEGVSLVKNYRSQFNQILSKESPQELLEKLQKKVKKA
jgi:phospholipid transport system substrate-binding protein